MRALIVLLAVAAAVPMAIEGKKYCGAEYTKWLAQVCTYGGENTPCLKPEETALADRCCQKGCGLEDMRQVCCFTPECLERCYPNSNRNRKQKLGGVY